MRVFLTGATGYLGTALVRRLAADGHELRALVRRTSRTDELERLGVATFPGDVTDRYSLREGMSGADWVIHLAGVTDPSAEPERMRAVHVAGNEAVASLAWKLGVGRLLATSSIAAFGGSAPDGTPADEESPRRTPHPTAYGATKEAGEAVLGEWTKRGLAANVVYPSLVYGPPGKSFGANGLLDALDRGSFPALVAADKKASWLYIDDFVDACVRVLEAAPAGRDYLLAGDVVTVSELAGKVAAHGGAKPPKLSVPLPLARAAAVAASPLFRLVGREPPLPVDQLANLGRHWAFSDERARRELDWRPRSLDEGLPPTLEHLRRQRGARDGGETETE